jgi:2-succinyl-5-enolpyruvyl-6-hydroxy-3-cyclohexene-1-carboxylate synthase
LGDLAFFYDFNSLGNRHLGKNIRIILINNGRGTEFKLTGNPGAMFGEDTDKYIAAAGHYGQKSKDLVKHYAQDLGFEYYSAENKDEYLNVLEHLISPTISVPIMVEVFTESKNEDLALTTLGTLATTKLKTVIREIKDFTRSTIGERGTQVLSKMLGK